MTNSFKYTPPSDQKSARGIIRRAADIALRGNMGSANFLERGSGKAGLSRAEIIRQVRAARPATVKKFRASGFQNRAFSVARITNKPTINGFHVVGMGNIPQITLNELKLKLGANGFTSYRFGGLAARSLFTGKAKS